MKTKNIILIAVSFALCLAGSSTWAGKPLKSGDIIVAQIVEMSPDRLMVQAGDYSFRLGPLFLGNDKGELPAARFELQTDQWLQIEVGYTGGRYLEAKKMVILKETRLMEALLALAQQ